MHSDIAIIGLGAITSVGLNVAATAAAVRAGIDGFEEHPFMISQEGEPYILGMVPVVEPELFGTQRMLKLAVAAAEEALIPLKKQISLMGTIITITGLPETRPGIPDGLELPIKDNLSSHSNYSLKNFYTLQHGYSSGLMAMQHAKKILSNGECDFCLVGGVDSYIDPDMLDWIEENEQLHTPDNAWGFIPGEASGYCLLCTIETSQRLQLPIKAFLGDSASYMEINKIKTETVCIGEGLTKAVKQVTEPLTDSTKLDYMICDMNGDAYRADEFGFMLARLSNRFKDPSNFLAPADCWGDIGAASGPLYVSLLSVAAEKSYSEGSNNLLWTSSENGERSSTIIKTVNQQQGIY